MKRVLIFIVGLIVIGIGGAVGLRLYTKSFSPEQETRFQGASLELKVNYCSPYRKGRMVFGVEDADAVVPFGQIWRTGANEATQITFGQAVRIEHHDVPAGSYSIFTIPRAQAWTVILNKEVGQWGTDYDPEKDLLRIKVPVQKMEETLERFRMNFEETAYGADLVMRWERTEVRLPIAKK